MRRISMVYRSMTVARVSIEDGPSFECELVGPGHSINDVVLKTEDHVSYEEHRDIADRLASTFRLLKRQEEVSE